MNNDKQKFIQAVWGYYNLNNRKMPWREPLGNGEFDPYRILVSELMLQQTQVDRVVPKFEAFMQKFPTIDSLAGATLQEVLQSWSGLGYNRRAKYLQDAAKALAGGTFPTTIDELTELKGIGRNTAAAILVYSYNMPVAFVETNVRTALIHHFTSNEKSIDENSFLALAEDVLDKSNPREWYWALMDYGANLKKSGVKNLSKAKIHKKQSKFEGSLRQIRGMILRSVKDSPIDEESLRNLVNDNRVNDALHGLKSDGLIEIEGDGTVRVSSG